MPSTPSIYREQIEGSPAAAVPAHAGHGHDDGHGHGPGHVPGDLHAHVVAPYILIAVFAALVALTGLTVGVTYFDFGYNINLIVALSIAVLKAVLVVLFFMHLKWDSPFYSFIVTLCLIFIGVFIIFTILDTGAYAPILTPTNVQPG